MVQVLGHATASHKQIAIGARPLTVGAHASCDLVLEDPKVSRKHAELAIVPEGIRIKDLGSTNGTWYQGTKVGEVVVPAGATVKFGETSVRVSAGDAPSGRIVSMSHATSAAVRSISEAESGVSRVVIDLSAVTFIDSTALGVLIGGVRRLHSGGGAMALVVTGRPVQRVLSITGLDRVFTIHATLDEAVAALA